MVLVENARSYSNPFDLSTHAPQIGNVEYAERWFMRERPEFETITNVIGVTLSRAKSPVAEVFIVNIRDAREPSWPTERARIEAFISTYQPDSIVVAGVTPSAFLMRDWLNFDVPKVQDRTKQIDEVERAYVIRRLGLPFELSLSYGKAALIFAIDVYACATQNYDEAKSLPTLLGLFMRQLMTAIDGVLPSTISSEPINTVIVTKVDDALALLEKMRTAPIKAIDTETQDLNRKSPVLYTIQVTFDGVTVYVLPVFHYATPFLPDELQKILDAGRFMLEHGEGTFVMHNAVFDVTVLAQTFGAEFVAPSLYDIMAGEFYLDENLKFIYSVYGVGGYSLAMLAARRGSFAYEQTKVKKEDRSNLSAVDFKDLAEYGAIDAALTYRIAKSQISQADALGYDWFWTFQTGQFSDMLHSFSVMERKGLPVDFDKAAKLVADDGPLVHLINEVYHQLYAAPEVLEANKRLSGGLTRMTLFDDVSFMFDISKPAHQKVLFLDVCGLAPVAYTKTEQPKIDKNFLGRYAKSTPVVADFARFKMLTTLKDNFAHGIYTKIASVPECREDHRIRPRFEFRDVVTGRSSSKDPNLQNLPQGSKESKLIKELFVAPPGMIFSEYDYNAHEVRGWGNVSHDPAIASIFAPGIELRLKQRLLIEHNFEAFLAWESRAKEIKWKDKATTIPDKQAMIPSIKAENSLFADFAQLELDLAVKGDVHIQNVKLFYGQDVDKDHPLRKQVKFAVFGVMYGRGAKALAKQIYDTDEPNETETAEAQALIDLMLKEKYVKGGEYLRRLQAQAARTFTVTSPIKRQRHLWGYLHNLKSFKTAMDRRGPNSDIQGLSSDCGMAASRRTEEMCWHFFAKHGKSLRQEHVNYVHDSSKALIPIEYLPIYTYLQEHGATTCVHNEYLNKYGFDMMMGLEVEFGFGPDMSKIERWTGAFASLGAVAEATAKAQVEKGLLTPELASAKVAACRHNASLVAQIRSHEIQTFLSERGPVFRPNRKMWMTAENALTVPWAFL